MLKKEYAEVVQEFNWHCLWKKLVETQNLDWNTNIHFELSLALTSAYTTYLNWPLISLGSPFPIVTSLIYPKLTFMFLPNRFPRTQSCGTRPRRRSQKPKPPIRDVSRAFRNTGTGLCLSMVFWRRTFNQRQHTSSRWEWGANTWEWGRSEYTVRSL